VLVAAVLVGCTLASHALAATPTLLQQFKSSSGRTAIEYFSYDSGPCLPGVSCNFRDVIKVPRGFDEVQVFLAGFKLEAANQADAVQQVSATVRKYRYDATTGELEVGVTASLRTASNQPYSYSTTFVVVLTRAGVAQYTTVSTGCAGIRSCRIVRSLPAAVPAGMHYIGIGTQDWHLGSHSGALLLNTLSGHQDGLTVAPPRVDLEYLCMMQGARMRNRMYCEWSAQVIAFDPAEMEQNGSSIFPQYTFVSWGTTARHAWTEHAPSPSHSRLAGFLDAFEGLTLTYQTFPYGPLVQRPVWLIESSAENFQLDPGAPDTALTDYGIFLGTQFGNSTTAQQYGFQESRAFGFLR
jgi:hypothetical protein